MYDNTARIMCFTVKGTEPLTFFTTKKFIAILSQKLGVDLICICTCYITHRVSGYRVKDVLQWKNGQQTQTQTQTNNNKVNIFKKSLTIPGGGGPHPGDPAAARWGRRRGA